MRSSQGEYKMENNLPTGSIEYDKMNNYCKQFEKMPFPTWMFNPPQKDEFLKKICSKKCQQCPFFGWPMPDPAEMEKTVQSA